MEGFDLWLLWNYGFEPDHRTPIYLRPPMFVREDGCFDVEGFEKWKQELKEIYDHA